MFLVISLRMVSVIADNIAVLTGIQLVIYNNPFLHSEQGFLLMCCISYYSGPVFLLILSHNSFVPFFRGKII